nr:hypothetical protein BaRGS_004750 [Batillaria attramentaria]
MNIGLLDVDCVKNVTHVDEVYDEIIFDIVNAISDDTPQPVTVTCEGFVPITRDPSDDDDDDDDTTCAKLVTAFVTSRLDYCVCFVADSRQLRLVVVQA